LVFQNLLFGRLPADRPYPGYFRACDPAVQVFATTAPTGTDPLAVIGRAPGFTLLLAGDAGPHLPVAAVHVGAGR
jgi:hypothetical protein